MHKRLTLALLITFVFTFWASACFADEAQSDSPKKEKRPPITVLHAALDKDCSQGIHDLKYKCTIWLRNVSGDDVDGVKVRLRMRDGSRKFYEETKEVDTIKPGNRIFVVFKWEDHRNLELIPELFLTYINSEGKEVEYQAYVPTWELSS